MLIGRHVSRSAIETRRLAGRLARRLKPGDAVALVGQLGAGKTEFVRGIAEAFGVGGEVSSPSFVRVHSYGGTPNLSHADFYLAKSIEDALDYGIDDLLAAGGIVLIEWSDRYPELIPAGSWWVRLDLGAGGPKERLVTIRVTD